MIKESFTCKRRLFRCSGGQSRAASTCRAMHRLLSFADVNLALARLSVTCSCSARRQVHRVDVPNLLWTDHDADRSICMLRTRGCGRLLAN